MKRIAVAEEKAGLVLKAHRNAIDNASEGWIGGFMKNQTSCRNLFRNWLCFGGGFCLAAKLL
jgi:hypothetical protein